MEINPLPMLSLKGRLDYMLQIWLPVPYKKKIPGRDDVSFIPPRPEKRSAPLYSRKFPLILLLQKKFCSSSFQTVKLQHSRNSRLTLLILKYFFIYSSIFV